MASENEQVYERIRALNCDSCPVQKMLGLNVRVEHLREAVELALLLLPKLKAERALAARTAELAKLLGT